MDSWGRSREVEKPKPIKLQASDAATKLIQAREALRVLEGTHQANAQYGLQATLDQAIRVLLVVAGDAALHLKSYAS